jgi:hypothetical protein
MTIQKKKLFVVAGVTAAVVGAGVYGWQRSVHREASLMPPALPASSLSTGWNRAREAKDVVPASTVQSAAGKLKVGNSTPATYKEAFAEARNYWEYAHQILPAAKAGNANAQFYLARLMERCSEDNKMYFQHKGATLNVDEALQYAVKRGLPVERVQTTYERCHEFQNQDLAELGSATDWLAKATESGQPLAQTTTATKIFMHDTQVNFAEAGGVLDPGPSIGAGMDPRDLLRAAVESKDPEVLFDIGSLQGTLTQTTPTDEKTMRYAWWLVACQRGFDCSTKAEWVINSCNNAPMCASANSPSDLVRTFSGDNWPDVQQRALEINAKLDAGQWGALGLGS